MANKIINKHRVTVWGRFPSLNEFITANRRNIHCANNMKHQAEWAIIACLRAQLGKLKIHNKIYIRYKFYEPNKKRDLDNVSGYFHKVFQDSLVACGILPNDNWQWIGGYKDEFFIDSNKPRIEVTLYEVKE